MDIVIVALFSEVCCVPSKLSKQDFQQHHVCVFKTNRKDSSDLKNNDNCFLTGFRLMLNLGYHNRHDWT